MRWSNNPNETYRNELNSICLFFCSRCHQFGIAFSRPFEETFLSAKVFKLQTKWIVKMLINHTNIGFHPILMDTHLFCGLVRFYSFVISKIIHLSIYNVLSVYCLRGQYHSGLWSMLHWYSRKFSRYMFTIGLFVD